MAEGRNGLREQHIVRALIILTGLFLLVSILLPLGSLFEKAVTNTSGEFTGLDNFSHYFSSESLRRSLLHSLFIALNSTGIAIILAFFFAYAVNRTAIPGKTFFKSVILIPLFAPTMMYALGLVHLLGNKGLITTGMFGALQTLPPWNGTVLDISLYGPLGIIIAEVIYILPQAYLIISVALSSADFRLYEAARCMGAGRLRRFLTITLPGIKYGLLSAAFVCFNLSFTDFGAPKVIGGSYSVLATDIYKQVVGQQNISMGAAVSLILLLPALLAFILDRILQRRETGSISSRATPYLIEKSAGRDRFFLAICILITLAILLLLFAVLAAALVKSWPYDMSLTLRHFTFQGVAGEGMTSFFNSLFIAFASAASGSLFIFFGAWLIDRSKALPGLRRFSYLLAILPMAIPGMVIGLAYIFLFNTPHISLPGLEIPNPLNLLYGTPLLIILANIIHFLPVSFLTATTAVKKLDPEYEEVSKSMGISIFHTFRRVTVPVSLEALLEIFLYLFVNSMVTISAVIFLYTPEWKLASIAIVHMEEAGDMAPAAAMSVLIILVNLFIRGLYLAFSKHRARKRGELPVPRIP